MPYCWLGTYVEFSLESLSSLLLVVLVVVLVKVPPVLAPEEDELVAHPLVRGLPPGAPVGGAQPGQDAPAGPDLGVAAGVPGAAGAVAAVRAELGLGLLGLTELGSEKDVKSTGHYCTVQPGELVADHVSVDHLHEELPEPLPAEEEEDGPEERDRPEDVPVVGGEDGRAQRQEGDDDAVEDHPGQQQPDVVPRDGDQHQHVRHQHERDGEQDHLWKNREILKLLVD